MSAKKLTRVEEIAKIWSVLGEVARNQRETSAQQRKTDAQQRKTDAQQRKTDAQLAKTDTKLRSVGIQLGNEGNRLGRLAEALTANDLKDFMQDHFSVEIHHIIKRFHIDHLLSGDSSDIDVLGINGDIVVAVEVKATIDKSGIDEFKCMVLDRFHEIIPTTQKLVNIQREKIYGGIAYLKTPTKKNGRDNEASIVKYAEEQGLFVMKLLGKKQSKLLNSRGFVLKNHQPPLT